VVAVIDNTTGATLLSCTVNATTRNTCSAPGGTTAASPGDNLEVRVTTSGLSPFYKDWRVTFRD
jgi:hypothetical protein